MPHTQANKETILDATRQQNQKYDTKIIGTFNPLQHLH